MSFLVIYFIWEENNPNEGAKSNILKSYQDTILKEEKITAILDFVLKNDSVTRNLKKDRFSKKIIIRYHINNRNDEEEKSLEEIIGLQLLSTGKKNAAEFAKFENIHEKILFIIIDN